MIINNLSKMVLLAPDFHKWPDLTHERPALIRTAEGINSRVEMVHPKLWRVIIDTSKWANVVLTLVSTNEQLKSLDWTLNWVEKSKFIEKLKQLPDYKWSKVEEAIEKWTIEIKKIPNREWYAIYESKTWNLIYITRLDWARYTNVDYFRTREVYWDLLETWYIRQWYSKIEFNKQSDLWILYDKNWKEIPIFSNEYSTATLNAVNFMWEGIEYFNKLIKEKENKK